jgi:hypothetical protein
MGGQPAVLSRWRAGADAQEAANRATAFSSQQMPVPGTFGTSTKPSMTWRGSASTGAALRWELEQVRTLLVGYGQITEPAIRAGITELADAITATRPTCRQ